MGSLRRLVTPDEVDEVLGQIVELRLLGLECIVECGRGLVGDEAGINVNLGAIGAVDNSLGPVFEVHQGPAGLNEVHQRPTSLDGRPVLIELLAGLEPVMWVGDEIRKPCGDDGSASRTGKPKA